MGRLTRASQRALYGLLFGLGRAGYRGVMLEDQEMCGLVDKNWYACT